MFRDGISCHSLTYPIKALPTFPEKPEDQEHFADEGELRN
jgi:hypothetical protein